MFCCNSESWNRNPIFSYRKAKHLDELNAVVCQLGETVNVIARNVSYFVQNFLTLCQLLNVPQTDCAKDMNVISSKLDSLKHNVISGVIEPTHQLHKKFVIEESLK